MPRSTLSSNEWRGGRCREGGRAWARLACLAEVAHRPGSMPLSSRRFAPKQRGIPVQVLRGDVEGTTERACKARRTVEAQPRRDVLHLHFRKAHQLVGCGSQPAATDVGG